MGPEAATLDQVVGLILLTIRRIVERESTPETPVEAVQRGLRALGLDRAESERLAVEAATGLTEIVTHR